MSLEKPPPTLFVGSPLDRVLKALNHPLRRRILRELSRGPASASSLAKVFDEEVGAVSYHLNQVLAKECGVVRLVEEVARRGALEKVWGLNQAIWKEVMTTPELASADCKLLPLEVDEPTWQEICAARRDFQDRIAAAVEAGRSYSGSSDQGSTQRVIVGVAAFATCGGAAASH
jgi:DNA-binding transcriptional ArsR family regulator